MADDLSRELDDVEVFERSQGVLHEVPHAFLHAARVGKGRHVDVDEAVEIGLEGRAEGHHDGRWYRPFAEKWPALRAPC